jgi:hypothetical protein
VPNQIQWWGLSASKKILWPSTSGANNKIAFNVACCCGTIEPTDCTYSITVEWIADAPPGATVEWLDNNDAGNDGGGGPGTGVSYAGLSTPGDWLVTTVGTGGGKVRIVVTRDGTNTHDICVNGVTLTAASPTWTYIMSDETVGVLISCGACP